MHVIYKSIDELKEAVDNLEMVILELDDDYQFPDAAPMRKKVFTAVNQRLDPAITKLEEMVQELEKIRKHLHKQES